MDNPLLLPSGFLIVDKPFGWTSFDCVNKIAWTMKNSLGLKKKPKVGHAGTLDPHATGVLVVAVGKATKSLEQLKGADKDYVAEIGFGVKSETYDLDGEVEFIEDIILNPSNTSLSKFLTEVNVEKILSEFRGEIDQMPPKFSALKVGGKRAYDLARAGKEFELKPRKVVIEKLEFMDSGIKEVSAAPSLVKVPFIKVFATVSKGTYMRSLARDIGEILGAPAALIGLRRTRVGQATLGGVIKLNSDMNSSLDGCGRVVKLSKETSFEQLKAGLIGVSELI
ncbi:tRNA pseudouridine(55) synthase TruB [Candidatus Peregrinibacteria bacterium]|nr:tRNA pseudouridine(55) synthase TruB [Candidatus Peregrinibacteria bacterium]